MPDTDIRPSSTSSKRSESAARNAFPMLSAAREAPAQPENVGSFERKLLDCLYDGVYFVDADRTITYWNQAAERLTGYAAEEAVGRHCFDNFLMHVDDRGSPLCLTGCPLSLTVSDGELREAHVFLRHKQGHRVPVCVRVSPIRDERGSIRGAVEIFSDSTAMRKLEERACEFEALAYSDALTGAANRAIST